MGSDDVKMREPLDHEVRAIHEYVESQVPDAPVGLVQLLHERKILSRTHEVWDVHTSEDRWWVITDPTNLYLQSDFPNYEVALIFHVGLGVVMVERSRKELADPDREVALGACWRRYTQAADAYNSAHEAEEFQAVGIHCRETLLSVARSMSSEPWVVVQDAPPKVDDFKAWNVGAA